jgi:uncharacterized iron-regulated protein
MFCFVSPIPLAIAGVTGQSIEPFIIALPGLQKISQKVLLEEISQKDIVILGEVHDNLEQHQIHGELIAQLNQQRQFINTQSNANRPFSVVVEHLPAGSQPKLNIKLEDALASAGFNFKAWNWPAHEVLFNAVALSGLELHGGSLLSKDEKQIYQTNGDNSPEYLKPLIEKATLNKAGQNRIFGEIRDGHCGFFPENQLPQMASVQRARDASLAYESVQFSPSILIVGNGHAWKDIGVPQVLKENYPKKSVVSILFLEDGGKKNSNKFRSLAKKFVNKADYIWFTTTTQRVDPCESLRPKS